MSGGLRFNEGKRRLDLLDVEALDGVAEVLSAGARKYAERNWEQGMAWSKPYASLLRHLFAFWKGEDLDPETGLPHIDHVACNAMFLQAYWRRNQAEDDRPKRSTRLGDGGNDEEGEATSSPNPSPDPAGELSGVYHATGLDASWFEVGLPVASKGFYERLLAEPIRRASRNAQDYEE